MDALQIIRLTAKEFEDLDDDTILSWIELTKPLISQKRFGKLYEQALAALTAHRLKMAGFGDSALGTVGDALRVSSYSEGSTSVSFGLSQATNLEADAEFTMTQYGIRYLTLRRMVIIPILSSGEA